MSSGKYINNPAKQSQSNILLSINLLTFFVPDFRALLNYCTTDMKNERTQPKHCLFLWCLSYFLAFLFKFSIFILCFHPVFVLFLFFVPLHLLIPFFPFLSLFFHFFYLFLVFIFFSTFLQYALLLSRSFLSRETSSLPSCFVASSTFPTFSKDFQ